MAYSVAMRDVRTGKIYFTKATCEELGPDFARAGYNIRKIRTLEQALRAWLATLSDEAVAEFWRVIQERRDEQRKLETVDAPDPTPTLDRI